MCPSFPNMSPHEHPRQPSLNGYGRGYGQRHGARWPREGLVGGQSVQGAACIVDGVTIQIAVEGASALFIGHPQV